MHFNAGPMLTIKKAEYYRLGLTDLFYFIFCIFFTYYVFISNIFLWILFLRNHDKINTATIESVSNEV